MTPRQKRAQLPLPTDESCEGNPDTPFADELVGLTGNAGIAPGVKGESPSAPHTAWQTALADPAVRAALEKDAVALCKVFWSGAALFSLLVGFKLFLASSKLLFKLADSLLSRYELREKKLSMFLENRIRRKPR